jgi:hypothetical protein
MKNLFRFSTAIVLSTFIFSSCNTAMKPELVVENFLNSMNQQDFETARKYCTEETFKLVDFLSSIAEMAKQEGAAFADAEPVSNIQCNVDGDKAKCTFCCDSEGKDSEVDLIKVKNEWKVNISFDGFGDMDMSDLLDTSYMMAPETELLDGIDAESAE